MCAYLNTYICAYINIYTYMCICTCICTKVYVCTSVYVEAIDEWIYFVICSGCQVSPAFDTNQVRRDEGVLRWAIMMMMEIRRRWNWCSLWALRASTRPAFLMSNIFEQSLLFETQGGAFMGWNVKQDIISTKGISGYIRVYWGILGYMMILAAILCFNFCLVK